MAPGAIGRYYLYPLNMTDLNGDGDIIGTEEGYVRSKDLNDDGVIDQIELKALLLMTDRSAAVMLTRKNKKILRSYLEQGKKKISQEIWGMQPKNPCDRRTQECGPIFGIQERLLNLAKVAALGERINLSYDEMKTYMTEMMWIASFLPEIFHVAWNDDCTKDFCSDTSLYARREIKDIMLDAGISEAETSGILTRLGFEYPSCLKPTN